MRRVWIFSRAAHSDFLMGTFNFVVCFFVLLTWWIENKEGLLCPTVPELLTNAHAPGKGMIKLSLLFDHQKVYFYTKFIREHCVTNSRFALISCTIHFARCFHVSFCFLVMVFKRYLENKSLRTETVKFCNWQITATITKSTALPQIQFSPLVAYFKYVTRWDGWNSSKEAYYNYVTLNWLVKSCKSKLSSNQPVYHDCHILQWWLLINKFTF